MVRARRLLAVKLVLGIVTIMRMLKWLNRLKNRLTRQTNARRMGQSQRRTGIALAEMLEQRALLAAVSDGGGTTLTISLGTGEDFAVVSNGTTYTFSVDTSFTNGG